MFRVIHCAQSCRASAAVRSSDASTPFARKNSQKSRTRSSCARSLWAYETKTRTGTALSGPPAARYPPAASCTLVIPHRSPPTSTAQPPQSTQRPAMTVRLPTPDLGQSSIPAGSLSGRTNGFRASSRSQTRCHSPQPRRERRHRALGRAEYVPRSSLEIGTRQVRQVKGRVLKTAVGCKPHRGFESHTLRADQRKRRISGSRRGHPHRSAASRAPPRLGLGPPSGVALRLATAQRLGRRSRVSIGRAEQRFCSSTCRRRAVTVPSRSTFRLTGTHSAQRCGQGIGGAVMALRSRQRRYIGE
jgi:hypothetical protein